jgi:hypothetical protein
LGGLVVHNSGMRRILALHACFVLLVALLMAPFQHVHPALDQGYDRHSAIIHIHPYLVSVPAGGDTQTTIGSSRGGESAWSLDSFSLVSHAVAFVFIQPESPALVFSAYKSCGEVVVVEERGHDPPWIDPAIPRAPPA